MRGQVALVTGGGSGIGAALCTRLTARGATVLIADVDESGAEKVACELDAHAICLDVTSKTAWHEAMTRLVQEHGRLDAVALNAGVMTRPRGERSDDDPLQWMMRRYEAMRAVNADGVVYGILATTPILEATGGGRIVVTSSGAGLAPLPMDPAYALTKHGVVGLVRSIGPWLADRGISIGAVCPGGVDTPLVSPDIRELDRPFAPPDHVASELEAVLDKPLSETGGIWVTRGLDPLWRYEFASPKSPSEAQ